MGNAHDHLDGDVRANPTGDCIGVKAERGTMSDEQAQSEADDRRQLLLPVGDN
jgi:hypothetical protein